MNLFNRTCGRMEIGDEKDIVQYLYRVLVGIAVGHRRGMYVLLCISTLCIESGIVGNRRYRSGRERNHLQGLNHISKTY